MDAATEYERKLEAPDGFELPDLGGEPLEPRIFTSVYHDTPHLSLAHAGITLRRRTERGRSVWQLKLPAGDARLELEEPGGPTAPPAAMGKLLVAHVRNGSLAPVAELRTRRHGALVARKGTKAEVTIDDVSVMDALRVVEEFVELEVELMAGKPKQLDRIADELEEAGAHRTDGTPKLFRVLRLTPDPTPSDAPLDALRARLLEQLRALLANDPGTRLGREPESLHDMRVAVRRTRALLRAGKRLYSNDVSTFVEELRWLGEKLGAVRDLDVMIERLHSESADLDAGALLRELGQRRSRARASLLKALNGRRYFELLDRFPLELDMLALGDSEVTVSGLARHELKKLRKRVDATRSDAPDEDLHALRKRGKRVRYAYELAGDADVVKRAKVFQDVLGTHQDAVVAEATLRELAATSPEHAIVTGRLIERGYRARNDARKRWRKTWARLERSAR